MFRSLCAVVTAAVLALSAAPAWANTYYVAQNDPAANNTNPGTEALPWMTIAKANSTLEAGDTVYVKEGTYNERIMPSRSGSPGAYISYVRYGQDQVVLSGNTEPGIWIYQKSYILVDGFTSDWVNKHVWIQSSACYNIIQNCHFKNAHSTGGTKSGVMIDAYSSYNKILNNIIEASGTIGGDSLTIQTGSNRNLVTGNSIVRGGHTCFSIRAGSYNVLRDNYFINPIQKIGEVYDQPHIDPNLAAERNVFQDNIFDYVPPVLNLAPYSHIQYAGQRGIIRRNRFFNSDTESLQMALYPDEAMRNTGNRIYNNVFYDNGESGIFIPNVRSGEIFSDNIFKNNILYNNYYTQHDFRFSWLATLDGKDNQLNIGRLSGYLFLRNNMYTNRGGDDWVIVAGWRSPLLNPPNHTVAWFDANYPALFQNNLQVEPQFVDAPNHDFHLAAGSPMIDAGVHLTQAVGSGTSNTITVADASYFYDGFGIAGEEGDWIRLAGTSQTAQIVAADYGANLLTLDRVVTVTTGQGVTLKYSGSAPDLGAFEYVAPSCVAGRNVFYNNSYFDGNDSAANANDDPAIATDKTSLLPGGTATFANYTSYGRGINGVIVDIDSLGGTPTVSDFVLKVGNSSSPASWSAAPAPISITVRPGDGTGGSDRVTIIWADNTIQNQWLQVTVLATANTGLASPDVFYFGNLTGEASGDGDVTPTDEVAVRNNPHTLGVNPATITEVCDFNRNRKVGPTEVIIVRDNGGHQLQLITVP